MAPLSPRVFYRIQDDSSHTVMHAGGLTAQGTDSRIFFDNPRCELLREALEKHLDWRCSTPSPFISVYADHVPAFREAERRHREGHENVVVITMDLAGLRGVEWRNLRILAERVGLWIGKFAWNNSESEYVFLKHIPSEAIVDIERL